MTMTKPSAGRTIAVSISESPDMLALGLSDEHLRDAMVEIARHMLQTGSHLAYGGDLRQHGFSELLFEIVARYRPVGDDVNEFVGATNYLAWPVHIQMSITKIEETAEALLGSAQLVCLDIDGSPVTPGERRQCRQEQPTEKAWSDGLNAMRRHMLAESDARIVLGGRVDRYKGAMPGIGEEALLSLNARQPLFVVGGFGGCARDIAESVGLVETRMFDHRTWQGREAFAKFSAEDLNNGLTFEDNAVLASTPHIDQAIVLIRRGLLNV